MEYKDWLDKVKVLQKAVLVDDDGLVLILKRAFREWDKRSLKADLCGGSISEEDLKGEKDLHLVAIKREIREETGLGVYHLEPVFVGSEVKNNSGGEKTFIIGIGYIARVSGSKPEIVLNENEHSSGEWVKKESVLENDFGDDGGFCKNILDQV